MLRNHCFACIVATTLAAFTATGCGEGSPLEPPIGDPCTFGDLEGTVIGSASECLLDDAFCVERPDGTWCTGGSPPPECPADATEIPSDAPCPEGFSCWHPGFARQCARPI